MYIVKKCENHSYGKNKWDTIHTTPDREDAIAFIREEYRLLVSSDPNLSSKDIDVRMNGSYGCPSSGTSIYGRKEFGHGKTRFSIMWSDSVKPAVRPNKNKVLDNILGR